MIRKITRRWLGGIFVCLSLTLQAQSFVETALLFSRTYPGGSARIQSLGGSQISIGGDFSAALSNPAGLGMYNRSEVTLSPAVNISKSTASYLGETNSANYTTFHIPAFSMAFHNDYGKLSGFLGGTFAIAFTRTNDFNKNYQYAATNPNNSIIDYFLEEAEGFPVSQFSPGGGLRNTPTHLAYENYLIGDSTVIDPAANPNSYFTDVLGIPFQSEEIETRRAQNQWSFGYGANYNDRLFIGASVGVTTLRYESKKIFREEFQNEPLFDLQLEESLEIRGSGINATIGATYRPTDIFQVGFSATTPTRYELTDTYFATMYTNWNNFQYDAFTLLTDEQYTSDILSSDYNLTTPGKANAGATVFFKKTGFVTMDVEYINYGNAKYSSITQGISFDGENEDIKSLYRSVFNLRAGGEYRFNNYRFRAGYSYMPDPFNSPQNNVSNTIQRITAGIGYRQSNFFIDMAVIHTFADDSYRPYTINSVNSPLVTYKTNSTNIMFTLGLPF